MATRIGGFRRKSRYKLKKDNKEKGKLSLSKFFQQVEIGNKVCLKAEPAYQKGMYLPRFHGKIGVVKSKKGRCYEVLIKDMNKEKIVVVHPVHFKKVL